jgi:hypothetical protein
MKRLLSKLTYANVISTVALFLEVEGDYDQSIGGNFETQAGKVWRAASATEARLAGTTLNLGRSSCQPAARVTSVVNSFLKVTAEGSSTDVNVC